MQDAEILANWPPPHFDVKVTWKRTGEGVRHGTAYELLEGTFRTPCFGRVYDALPVESRSARVQLLLPKQEAQRRACVVHLAGTGDHHFTRRLNLGFPLLAQGIATMALESPFYGARRPPGQAGAKLMHVSDLLVLGRATIEESLCLLNWLQLQGFQRLGMSGFSMGGVHACMVAGLFPGDLACVPLLAPRSAAVAFCDGALWDATAWKPLTTDEDEAHHDITRTIHEAAQPSAITAAATRILEQDVEKLLREGWAAGDSAASSQAAAGPTLGTRMASEGQQYARADGSAPSSSGRRNGIDAAERQLGQLWRMRGKLKREAARMRLAQVLETYTDVTRFPRPQRPDAAVLVAATHDAYVSKQSVLELAEHWAGSEVRWVAGGHVSAFLMQQDAFRTAIRDSIGRL
ncbi:hypothetical protein WJX72_008631 [[Myrmecia] bisecta]|uniref:Uncharacterized protein n=1 Tax=[Myrmecia] bisecta TaxID=41462 RepID=A0AAW1QFV4_9CHLO